MISQMVSDLRNLLDSSETGLSPQQLDRVLEFYLALSKENEIQNLTNLISPQQFLDGHLQDVLELHKFALKEIKEGAIDLGSGCGVPGLLSACIEPNEWTLVESELRKAEFLTNAVDSLGLDTVDVVHERIENMEDWPMAPSIVARAVGSADKIYEWSRKSSTWNTLILFKGPKWDTEWAEARLSRAGKELTIHDLHEYVVGPEAKQRKIVILKRVPRGTNKNQ